MSNDRLPLRYATPDVWAHEVLRDPLALLNDHAYLEKKAANNALELLNRWPDPNPPNFWVEKMSAMAREEAEHLSLVARLLARRGGRMTKWHKNPYAYALRQLVRLGDGRHDTMDRLIVAGIIEARSSERFVLLGRHCQDAELARVFRELAAADLGHYLTFRELTYSLGRRDEVDARWDEMLAAEAEIIQRQAPGPRMHSGCGAGR